MSSPNPSLRECSLDRVRDRAEPWDMIVIGGGATGVGVTMDAASRGLQVLLVEQSDFGKGTSSRSTKLVHGGVRYLRQGNVTLVRDALRERSLLRDNAPHLVHDLPFLIPCQSLWQRFFYGFGLKIYDLLATGNRFARSRGVSTLRAIELVPPIKQEGLRGGVVYHDGQFDDARLLISMALTATDHGACLINYMPAEGLQKNHDGKIIGVEVVDSETNVRYRPLARTVVNAAGPFCDSVRMMDCPDDPPMIAASQGIHLVIPRSFFPGDVAMIVPKTSDGRVIFIIPWNDQAIIGTTDTPIAETPWEPYPQAEEIRFLLDTANEYLSETIRLSDVRSIYTGIRPLVKDDRSARTASLSRDHVIRVSKSGLITIAGGKWTTVRKMSEDCVDRAIEVGGLPANPCRTNSLRLHGVTESQTKDADQVYGSARTGLHELESETPALAERLHPDLFLRGSHVVWAVRHEMARTVDDVLSRRTRSLVLHARAAVDVAPEVARIMGAEMSCTPAWQEQQIQAFNDIAQRYLPPTSL